MAAIPSTASLQFSIAKLFVEYKFPLQQKSGNSVTKLPQILSSPNVISSLMFSMAFQTPLFTKVGQFTKKTLQPDL